MYAATLGWATAENATSPTVTPTELDSLQALANPLTACQPAKPYVYLDGSTRGFAGGLIYETEISIHPLNWSFLTTAGRLIYHKFIAWNYNEPKFMKTTDPVWLDLIGSGYVRITLMDKFVLVKAGGVQQVKFKLQVASVYTVIS